MNRYRDKDGCTWRPHPTVDSEWQILLPNGHWSDADYLPDEDGPLIPIGGLP